MEELKKIKNDERDNRLLNNLSETQYNNILSSVDADTIANNFNNYKDYIIKKLDEEYNKIKKDIRLTKNFSELRVEININLKLDTTDIVENGGKETIRDEKLNDLGI